MSDVVDIEAIDRQLVTIRERALEYERRYAEELSRLKEYEGFGGEKPVSWTNLDLLARLMAQGISYLIGGRSVSPSFPDVPRFVHAAQMLKKYDPLQSASKQAFAILKRLNKYGITRWSIETGMTVALPRTVTN